MSHTSPTVSIPMKRSALQPILQPIQAFLAAEYAGAILMISMGLVALVWANSPWGDAYYDLWHTKLSIGVGGAVRAMTLEHWVNDGLMVIFFLLVGLEIKRELLVGELASVRRASLPVAAAIGGMVVPAGLYAILNAGGPGASGWGVPMATDIAFAVGVLALVGRAVPTAITVFLLAVAIVDDLGAVLVIALFYTDQISTPALGVAGGFFAALVTLNLLRVHRPLPYMLLGLGLWAATLYSGVHATVAGVLLAFTIPASRQVEEAAYIQYQRAALAEFELDAEEAPDLITERQSQALKGMEEASKAVQTPLMRVEHALLSPVNFLIVPLFALANAGVDLRSVGASALENPISWGVLLGLLFGKPVGVLLASWAAIASGVAMMPEGGTRRQLVGVGLLSGIGFTMSLFVANLAFGRGAEELAAAKIGILAASLLAGVAGAAVLATARPRVEPAPIESASS